MRKPNLCRIIMFAAEVLGIILAGIAGVVYGVEPVHPLFIMGAVVAVARLIFGWITVRCPYCRHSLDLHLSGAGDYCPYCGEKLS